MGVELHVIVAVLAEWLWMLLVLSDLLGLSSPMSLELLMILLPSDPLCLVLLSSDSLCLVLLSSDCLVLLSSDLLPFRVSCSRSYK